MSRSLVESAQQIWMAGVGAFTRAQGEGSKLFEALVKEGMTIEQTTRKLATGKVDAVRDAVEDRVGVVRERAVDTWDRLETVFETRVQRALNRLGVPAREDLADLTSRVNDLMCQNTGGTKFVTFFWGIIDAEAMTLSYVNAGHNHPYLLREGGQVERLDKGGMILGVIPTAMPYEEGLAPLQAGDVIVLFTDGVSEAMDAHGVDYGEERLERLICATRNKPPAGILEAISEDVRRHAGGAPQSDDITMMVLRVSGA
jgi:poly(hydroxyalkanoate) granule-associated protein